MKVSLDIDSNYKETSITIHCKSLTPQIQQLIDSLTKEQADFIIGRDGEMQHILQPTEIHLFKTEHGAVVAVTKKGTFTVQEKLYELEQLLQSHPFIRISKAVLVNLYELSHFEPSFHGTLCVYLKSGVKEYVSRNYVPTIKKTLTTKRRNAR